MVNTAIVIMCSVLASTAFAAENVQVSQNCAQLALSTSHITVEWSNIKPYVHNSSKEMQGKFSSVFIQEIHKKVLLLF